MVYQKRIVIINQYGFIFGAVPQRGGPFTKDLSYAKGFVLIYNYIRFAISQKRVDSIRFTLYR